MEASDTASITRTVVPIIRTVVPIIRTVVPIIRTVVPIIRTVVPIIRTVVPIIRTVVPIPCDPFRYLYGYSDYPYRSAHKQCASGVRRAPTIRSQCGRPSPPPAPTLASAAATRSECLCVWLWPTHHCWTNGADPSARTSAARARPID
jgi:hypothetical protein